MGIIKKKKKKILLLVLFATWKHAREMHLANMRFHEYPKHMLRLALEKEDLKGFIPERFKIRGKASKKGYRQRRNNNEKASMSMSKSDSNHHDEQLQEDEEPFGGTWMSTAECIAWIVSKIEEVENSD